MTTELTPERIAEIEQLTPSAMCAKVFDQIAEREYVDGLSEDTLEDIDYIATCLEANGNLADLFNKIWRFFAAPYKADIKAMREKIDTQAAEITRLRSMIVYARQGPASAVDSILADALDGVNGAENVTEIRGERERLRESLETIKTQYGKVCPEFELCEHESCQSSCGAWLVADAALNGEPRHE